MNSLLGCKNLSVRFYNQKESILRNITLSIQEGEKVLILGPSGSGKSTLISVLAGIIPEHIEASVSGEVTRKPQVGVLFQDPDTQFCMLHVDEEIAFSLENRNIPRDKMDDIIIELLKVVGLEIEPSTAIETLSGGMKQRLALACLLALEPDVLFLDEPTAQLDPSSRKEIFDILRETAIRTKQTFVFVEHVLDGCIEWMDRVILLNRTGEIIADDVPAVVFKNYEKEIEDAGIWKPKIFPNDWKDILRDSDHPISNYLMERFKNREEKKRTLIPSEPIIQTKGLSVSYGKKPVLNEVNLTLHKGEWISIIGKNGSGKSSFLKVISNLKKRKNGEIYYNGRELKQWSYKELYQKMGFVFQNPELQFINQTVFEEIAFSGRENKWKEEDILSKTDHLLRELHLEKHRDYHPFTLSFGQKRRLSVGTMLLLDQDVLLLDEPTFGQDAKSAQELLAVLKKRQEQGTTIVMITHDMDIVDEYSDRVILFHEKKIFYNGDPYFLFSDAHLLHLASIPPPLHYQLIEDRKGEGNDQKQSVPTFST